MLKTEREKKDVSPAVRLSASRYIRVTFIFIHAIYRLHAVKCILFYLWEIVGYILWIKLLSDAVHSLVILYVYTY